jgi:hypothetical protein
VLSEKLKAIPGEGIPLARDALYSKVWDIAIAAIQTEELGGHNWTELETIFREELADMFADRNPASGAAVRIQGRWAAQLLQPNR